MSTTTTSPAASETCTRPQPGKNGYLPPEACEVILYYVPSLAAAIIFSVLFGLSLILFGIQGFQYKKRYSWVIMMGALWECLAFVFRALLTRHQDSGGYNTAFNLLFFLAPLWVNAFLYMTLGRMVYTFLPDRRLAGITATRYGVIFVWLDIVAFIVQATGAVMSSSTDSSNDFIMMGVHIYMGGIGLQELFIVIFSVLFIVLHRRMIRMEATGELPPEKVSRGSRPWRWLFYTVYFALFMITVRIIFRLAQFSRGMDVNNPVLTHEVYEYVFDAVPMFLALGALHFVHPGMVLRGPETEFPRLSRREKKQMKREKKERKRRAKLGGMDEYNSGGFDTLPIQEAGDRGGRYT